MIKDLKELQALLKLCRKQGVTKISLGDVSIDFGDLPKKLAFDVEEDDANEELNAEQVYQRIIDGMPIP